MKFKMMYSFLNADLQLIEKELEAAIEADSTVLRKLPCIYCNPVEKGSVRYSSYWVRSLATMIFMS